MRQHQANDQAEVVKLQNFLNQELSISIPVTGFFGPITESAVNQFQLKYSHDVLAPWIPYGLPNEHTPTGYEYKTTRYKINKIYCPTYDPGFPTLP